MRIRAAVVVLSAAYLVGVCLVVRMLYGTVVSIDAGDPVVNALVTNAFKLGAVAGGLVTLGILKVALTIRELATARKAAAAEVPPARWAVPH